MEKELKSSYYLLKGRTKRKSKYASIQNFVWFFLLFFSFSLPVNFQNVKIILLVILLVISMLNFFKSNRIFDKKYLGLLLLWLMFACPVVLIGFLKQNVGASAFAKVELLYPLLLFLALGSLKNKNVISVIYKAMLLSSIFISFYTFLLLLYNAGYLPISSFWIIDDTSAVGLHEGYTHITNTNLSMLIFIFPCICSLTSKERKKLRINSHLCRFCIAISFFAMFLSGRRILWIIAIISLVILFFRIRMNPLNKMFIVLFIFISAVIIFVVLGDKFNISIDGLWDRFINVFSEYDEYGQENVRYIQMNKLLEGFRNNVVFGAGGGAVLPGYYRSLESPWIFEASYHMILFNSGIVFFSIYVLFFARLLFLLLKKHKYYYGSISMFSALLFSIIANATNPYFSASFDFLFFIFVPIIFLNNKNYMRKGRAKK
ncbi:MAG: hypothetical protein IJR67_01775 [Acholeplasmatales bacterium]|nr:hypothetical protein [Acholeplasmatales bacterium]